MMRDAGLIVLAYLLGSLPAGYLFTRLATGKDIRREGNGNVGTRNALAVAGLLPGLATAACDLGKGLAAYEIARRWGSRELVVYLAGVAVMVGHWLPLWLRGRGGVGQAAVTGFLAGMWSVPFCLALPAYILARALVAHDMAYAVAAAVFVISVLWQGGSVAGLGYVVALQLATLGKHLLDQPRRRAVLAATDGELTEPRRRWT